MSYLTFLLVFLVPQIVLLWAWSRWRGGFPRGFGRALGLICLVALSYTVLWDNYLVYKGVWQYGPDRVLGTIGYVPVEEYAFFLLQPLLANLVLVPFLRRGAGPPLRRSATWRAPLVAWWLLLSLGAAAALVMGTERGLYLALILVWACPVLAGLTWLGYELLARQARALVVAIAATSLYLWTADALAIRWGIWSISERYSTGVLVAGLPIEEAVFFLLTTVMSVCGVVMLLPVARPVSVSDAP